MATHSGILAWKIPQTEEPGRFHSWGCKELDRTEHTESPQVCKGLDKISQEGNLGKSGLTKQRRQKNGP